MRILKLINSKKKQKMKTKLLNLKIAVLSLGVLFSINAKAFTAVTSGLWSSPATWGGVAPTATVSGQDIIIPSGFTVTLDADITFSALLNSFIVNGVLTNTTSNGIYMTQGSLSGNGTISVNKLSFATLATASFSGTANVKRLSNSVLSLGMTAITNVSDTLDLNSGNLMLNTNSNLTMMSNSTVKVNNGSITVSGGVFNSGNAYNVMYIGTSKTTGLELNTTTLQHAYLYMSSNTQVVTLNNNAVINGDLNIYSGKLSFNATQLTLKGNLGMVAGTSLISNATSNLIVQGTGTLSSYLMFDAGSSVNNITINRTSGGYVNLGNSLNVAGNLNLMDGNLNLQSGAVLAMNAASTVHVENGNLSVGSGSFNGTASYNVEYMGSNDVNSGAELTGTGLNNLMVNYTNNSTKVTMSNSVSVAGELKMTKGKLDLNGRNLVLNGTIAQTSNGQFIGNTNSELHLKLTGVTGDTIWFDNANQNNQTLSKLIVNISGVNALVLGSKVIIGNELNFQQGKIELSNSDLEIQSAASIIGYTDTKYVVTSQNASGSLVMNVNAGSPYVTFPVGTNINYSPAFIQQGSAASSGNFNVRAMNTVLSDGTSGLVNSNNLKLVNRTWFVYSSVSNINANIKFGWKTASEVNGFDRTNAYISHYTNGAWDVTGAGSATAGVNTTFEMSRSGITSLSPFTVVQAGEPLTIKEASKLTGIEMYPNPTKNVLYIKTGGSTENYSYELTNLLGKKLLSFTNNNEINKLESSTLEPGVYFVKITNLNDNKTITKRFVKE